MLVESIRGLGYISLWMKSEKFWLGIDHGKARHPKAGHDRLLISLTVHNYTCITLYGIFFPVRKETSIIYIYGDITL